nr:hypothetical protein [Tanacetum cinerariifolium]
MNQNFNYSNSFGFDQIQPSQQFDNHQPQEIPEFVSFIESKEWIETKNELYKLMEVYTERMNQQHTQEALLASQREQELHEQEQAAQEKEEPPQNSVFCQLTEEMCGTKFYEEQKQYMEDTMLELLEDCQQKELYCMHNDVEDLIKSALNSKLFLINLKSQRLDKEKQKVKNIVEQAPKRRTRLTKCLKNFKVIHNESIISLNKMPQIYLVKAITPVLPTEEPEYSLNDTCDVPICEDSSTLKYHYEILSDSNDDHTSSDDDSFEDIEFVEASLLDSELVSLEEVNDVEQKEKEIDLEDILQIQDVILREKLLSINRLIADIKFLNDNPTPDRVLKSSSSFPIPVTYSNSFFEKSDTSLSYLDNSLPKFKTFGDHTKETRSGSTTAHANNSLPEYDLFHFEIEPDQGRLTSIVMDNISNDSTNDPLLEAVDSFFASDNSIPPGIKNIDYDSEGDIHFREELLRNDSPSRK